MEEKNKHEIIEAFYTIQRNTGTFVEEIIDILTTVCFDPEQAKELLQTFEELQIGTDIKVTVTSSDNFKP